MSVRTDCRVCTRACVSLREFSREINLPKGGSICEQPIKGLEWWGRQEEFALVYKREEREGGVLV